MSGSASFDVLVVGGGAVGLATARELALEDGLRVGLVERFRIGHDRGSSHGHSRITRSSYADPLYVRLARIVQEHDWPRLERDAGVRLVHRFGALVYGPEDGAFADYAAAVAAVGVPVEAIEPGIARRRFPLLRFPDAVGVLHDRTAGVLAAAEVVAALARLCTIGGVHVLENTRAEALESAKDAIEVRTDRGVLRAGRVVLTAGAWASSLVPALAPALAVHRQNVGYFRLDAPPADVAPERFPAWIWLGPGRNGQRYGLPEFGQPGIKAAAHEVAGAPDDPDDRPGADAAAIERTRAFLAEHLAARVLEVTHAETCLYTCTDDEDFLIGALPDEPRILVGSACSGHGFKFVPLTGRILAHLALGRPTGVAPFEEQRGRFAPGAAV